MGDYSIAMDNGPARQAGVAVNLKEAGDKVADMFEVRREEGREEDGICPSLSIYLSVTFNLYIYLSI